MTSALHTQRNWSYTLSSSDNTFSIFSELQGQTYTWRRGTVIARENTPAQAVFFLLSGKVKIVKKDRQNHNFLLGLLRPGDSIGLQSVLRHEPHTATAVALEDVRINRIETAVFLQWLELHPTGFQLVLRLLCSELARAESRINTMIRISASARLADVLLMLDKAYGTDAHGNMAVVLKPREYADLTNVARGTMYRLLRRFVESGLITVQDMSIRLLNREKLRQLAGG